MTLTLAKLLRCKAELKEADQFERCKNCAEWSKGQCNCDDMLGVPVIYEAGTIPINCNDKLLTDKDCSCRNFKAKEKKNG